MAFQHLLLELGQWRERNVPEIVEELIANPRIPSRLRVNAWGLLLRRSGLKGVDRIRRRIRTDLERRRLSHEEWQELASLAELVATHRLPMGAILLELAASVPRRINPAFHRIHGALLGWHAANAAMPGSYSWLLDEGLPMFKTALKESATKGADIPWTWLEAFAECPPAILTRLAKITEEIWQMLTPDVQSELMQNFSRYPELFPSALLEEAMNSEDEDLREVAAELMLGVNPGRLVRERQDSPAIDHMMRETSAMSGILFFQDRLYTPQTCSFIPFDGAPKIPLPKPLGYWDIPTV